MLGRAKGEDGEAETDLGEIWGVISKPPSGANWRCVTECGRSSSSKLSNEELRFKPVKLISESSSSS